MNTVFRLLLLAFVFTFRPASAQEVVVGTGVVCDTAEQIKAVVTESFQTRALEPALQVVNGDTMACGLATVAYIRGATVGTIQTPDGLADIVAIMVVGGRAADGQFHAVRPVPQFTIFAAKGRDV